MVDKSRLCELHHRAGVMCSDRSLCFSCNQMSWRNVLDDNRWCDCSHTGPGTTWSTTIAGATQELERFSLADASVNTRAVATRFTTVGCAIATTRAGGLSSPPGTCAWPISRKLSSNVRKQSLVRLSTWNQWKCARPQPLVQLSTQKMELCAGSQSLLRLSPLT